MHGETTRDADRLPGNVGGIVRQQEGDKPRVIFRHAETPHRNGALEPLGDARTIRAFQKTAEWRYRSDRDKAC